MERCLRSVFYHLSCRFPQFRRMSLLDISTGPDRRRIPTRPRLQPFSASSMHTIIQTSRWRHRRIFKFDPLFHFLNNFPSLFNGYDIHIDHVIFLKFVIFIRHVVQVLLRILVCEMFIWLFRCFVMWNILLLLWTTFWRNYLTFLRPRRNMLAGSCSGDHRLLIQTAITNLTILSKVILNRGILRLGID